MDADSRGWEFLSCLTSLMLVVYCKPLFLLVKKKRRRRRRKKSVEDFDPLNSSVGSKQ